MRQVVYTGPMPLLRARLAFAFLPLALAAQTKTFKLDSTAGLTLQNVAATAEKFKGKKSVKITTSPEAAARMATPAAPPAAAPRGAGTKKGSAKKAAQKKGGAPAAPAGFLEQLALIDGVDFGNGVIEVDLAGEPAANAGVGARGFVGIAFRVQPDRLTYDCFYLRPTNGRSDDQERRNHTAQYIQHPDFPWFKLRQETPSRYESYVDIAPSEWIRVKIDVDGSKARLFVNKNSQPTLIVNDVKTGPLARGGVALWIDSSTVARFANLKITPR